MNHASDRQHGGADTLTLDVRPLGANDLGFVVATWRETFRQSSSKLIRLPWPLYKQMASVTRLVALAHDSETRMLGAHNADGRILGWIAYTPGRSVSTVHWCYTRNAFDGEETRRRGIMTALLEAADLGKRFAYTHRGVREVVHHGSRDRSPEATRHTTRGPTLDLALVSWLRDRGITATFIELEDWLK